jgi:hypothetical protein
MVVINRSARCLIRLLILLCAPEALADIALFTSDGCSAFPDGTPSQKTVWLECCYQHDYAYWKGGTREERAEADQALRACVAAVGEPGIATLMLAGVRVGGTPYLPTRFRWGYGWPFFRGYKALSEDELRQVESMSRAGPLPAMD